MNYTQLNTLLQEYLQNNETIFVADIPRFVRQAEERITRSFLIPELRKNATTSFTAGNEYLARPTDFLYPFSMAVVDGDGNYSYLTPKDVSFMREAYPNPDTTGLPAYYASFDGRDTLDNGHFIVAPTPASGYTVQLHYYYDPPSIVDSNTSWLGENAETALLYGSLVEAYVFLKGEQDLMALYKARYEEAVDHLQKVGKLTRRDGYRNGLAAAEM